MKKNNTSKKCGREKIFSLLLFVIFIRATESIILFFPRPKLEIPTTGTSFSAHDNRVFLGRIKYARAQRKIIKHSDDGDGDGGGCLRTVDRPINFDNVPTGWPAAKS